MECHRFPGNEEGDEGAGKGVLVEGMEPSARLEQS